MKAELVSEETNHSELAGIRAEIAKLFALARSIGGEAPVKVERIERGSGHCHDCRRGARVKVSVGDGSRCLTLCKRCAGYLATTLRARLEEWDRADRERE